MSSADGHVDHADLVFNLPHHDSGFARVRGHPVEHTRGRTHRIGAIKLHSGSRAPHGERDIAGKYRVLSIAHRKRIRKGLEVRSGVVITDAGNSEVFRYNFVTLSQELFGENFCKRLKTYAHHLQRGRQRQRVLLDLTAASLRELVYRKRAKLCAICMGTGFDRVCIVNNRGSRPHQTQVPVHRILVERNEQVDMITEARHFLNPGANGKKGVAATNDRLVGVVSIQVETAPGEDLGEDVSRCSHTLTCRSSYRNGESPFHKYAPLNLIKAEMTPYGAFTLQQPNSSARF